MKRTTMSSLLVPAMLATAMFATAAAPVMAEKRPPTAEDGKDHHGAKGRDDKARGGKDGAHKGGNPGLKLAQRLSGLETYIGITPEQAPAWRGYTDALIAFAEADMPPPGAGPAEGHGPRGDKAPPPGAQPEGGPEAGPPAQPPRLMAEILSERAIVKGEKAETLHAAAATLRASLSDEQLARLIRAEAPPKSPHGPKSGPGFGPEGGPDAPPPPRDAPDAP